MALALPLAFEGTPFQQSVWQALLTIPYGETRSYAEVARQIGQPTAMRVAQVPDADWLLADACELSTLTEAKVDECDVIVAATGDDKVNLVVSLLAKTEYGVPRVVARVNNPRNEWLFDDAWGVDVVVTGSQKAWMSAPGLAMVAASPRAWAATETATMPRFYLDLRAHRDSHASGQTPWTPALAVLYQVDEGLRLMDLETQAGVFARSGGGWSADGRTLPGVLDIEYNPYGATCYGKSKTKMVAWIKDFTTEYKRLTKRDAVIYTTTDWWQTCTGNSKAFSTTNPLWLARYGTSVGTLPGGWGYATFWQYTNVPLDQNRFSASYDRLVVLATEAA